MRRAVALVVALAVAALTSLLGAPAASAAVIANGGDTGWVWQDQNNGGYTWSKPFDGSRTLDLGALWVGGENGGSIPDTWTEGECIDPSTLVPNSYFLWHSGELSGNHRGPYTGGHGNCPGNSVVHFWRVRATDPRLGDAATGHIFWQYVWGPDLPCTPTDQRGCDQGTGEHPNQTLCDEYDWLTGGKFCLRWDGDVPNSYVRSWTFKVKVTFGGSLNISDLGRKGHWRIGYACAGSETVTTKDFSGGEGDKGSFQVGCYDSYVERFYALGEGTSHFDYQHVVMSWGARPGDAITPFVVGSALPTEFVPRCGPLVSGFVPCGGGNPTGANPAPAPGTEVTGTGGSSTPTSPGNPGGGCNVSVLDPSSWLCGLTDLFGGLLDLLQSILSWLENLGSWLVSLIVPPSGYLSEKADGLKTAFNDSAPKKVGDAAVGVGDAFGSFAGSDSGCAGPGVPWSIFHVGTGQAGDLHPFSTCTEPIHTVAHWVRLLLVVGIWGGALLAGLNIVLGAFGMASPWDGSELDP